MSSDNLTAPPSTTRSMFSQRMRARLNKSTGLSDLDSVVEQHGRIEGNPFSFKDHEFQREIVRDTHSRINVRKCAQVGLSEIMAQKIMAMMSVIQHQTLIFTMPTDAMASKFSKSRIDRIIEQSEYYGGMVQKANNSAGYKKIGTSDLFIGGTFGSTQAISVSARTVISDEVDFSNQQVLGQLSSRLRAAEEDEQGYKGRHYKFSTATVEDYGIDADFKEGDQRYYMCKCKSCSQWVVPDYFEDFVLPGFDRPIIELQKFHLRESHIRVADAWIRCPSCHNDLWSSLLDPERRQWVAKKPENWIHSYQVFPWDAPRTNSPSSILRDMEQQETDVDFINFSIGLPFSSPDNTFLVGEEPRAAQTKVDLWIYQRHIVKSPTVAGMDVGKVCHLTVMAKSGKFKYVVWAERISNAPTPATEEVLKRFDFFKVQKLCIDAGPDITLVNTLINSKPLGRIVAVEYVRSSPDALTTIKEAQEGSLIKANRTRTLKQLLSDHNSRVLHYAKEVWDMVAPHLSNTKKIRLKGETGEEAERFEKTGEDHFAHSLNYCNIAAKALEEFIPDAGDVTPVKARVGGVKVGDQSKSAVKARQDKNKRRGLVRIGR